MYAGEVGGDRYGVDMRGVERGIYPRSNMPRSFPKNQKTKIRSVSSWNLKRCEHTPLKYSPTKKEDLARGLKCSNFGGLVNYKYWHVKDAAGDFFGAGVVKVWGEIVEMEIKIIFLCLRDARLFSSIGKIKRIQVLRWRVSALMWAKLLKWNICTTIFSTFP